MQKRKENARLLASLTVFRELYNKQEDVYSIICKLLEYIIIKNGKYQFNLPEITGIMNTEFEFQLPESVVGTALAKLKYISKINNFYTVKQKPYVEQINDIEEKALNDNNLIYESLFSYIETHKEKKLNNEERQSIVSAFCSYLLDESSEEPYFDDISGFIIANMNNKEFINKINKIKEGVILYSGLKYNNNLSEVGSWKRDITIYLDTEIIFHLAGYNGNLFKLLFDDFYSYVKEINNNAKKEKIIKLKYFTETNDEIRGFFTKAKSIMEGKSNLNPEKPAMNYILDGCKEIGDIREKESDLFVLLRNMGIEEESCNFYEKDSHKYNIIGPELMESLVKKYDFDVMDSIKYLNYINILRGDNEQNNFYGIKAVLLTGNSRTIKIAWDDEIKNDRNVPLATTLHWITNKFWFKLNKGFGNNSLPKSFDVITKAQIGLSHLLSTSIGDKYQEAVSQYDKGKINEEIVKERIISLRSNVKKPEEIQQEGLDSILEFLSEDTLSRFMYKQEEFRKEAMQNKEENVILKEKIKEQENKIKNDEKSKTISQLLITKDAKETILEDKNKSFNHLLKQKEAITEKNEKVYQIIKKLFICLYCIYYCSLIVSVFIFDWNKIERFIFLLGLPPIIIPFLYFSIHEKTMNVKRIISNIKEKECNKRLKKIHFDNEYFDMLNNEIKELNNEIQNINTQIDLNTDHIGNM